MVEDEPLLTARANAADLGGTVPVAPAVGAALRFLTAAIGARAVVEIGTGCGSSGIWLLRGMRPGAVLTSVDTEPEYHRLARKSFAQAGFATNQARLILGRALDVIPRLSDGAYDLVFCDADQAHYPDYLTAGPAAAPRRRHRRLQRRAAAERGAGRGRRERTGRYGHRRRAAGSAAAAHRGRHTRRNQKIKPVIRNGRVASHRRPRAPRRRRGR